MSMLIETDPSFLCDKGWCNGIDQIAYLVERLEVLMSVVQKYAS